MILRVFHLHHVTHIYRLDRCRDHLPLGIYRAMQSHRIEASTSRPFRYRYAIGNIWCEAKAVYGDKKPQSNLGHLLSQAKDVVDDGDVTIDGVMPSMTAMTLLNVQYPSSLTFQLLHRFYRLHQ